MKAAEIFVLMRTRIQGEINTPSAAAIFVMWEAHTRTANSPYTVSSLLLAKFARKIYESS